MPTANKDNKASAALDLQEPQKLVQNLVDKKVRNLEKRKARLQELQQLAAKGQELEPEQQKAIKKLDQVVEMIDLMKDLSKSIIEVLTENTKQQKKTAKKEMLDKQIERQQQELDRLKTIIQYQDILTRFETTVRQDFSKGTNGAIKLTDEELSALDQLYAIVVDVTDDKIETTAEKLIALAEGKSREAWPKVTFHELKDLMTKIVATKYFSHESTAVSTTATISTIADNSNTKSKPKAVSVTKKEESIKKFEKDSDSSSSTKAPTLSSQYPNSVANNDFSSSLTQLQSQFTSGISFMTRDPLVEKDPAVVAVASVANSFPYQPFDTLMSTSIPDSNNSSINPQKTSNYDNTSSMSTIPTQTYTNQQFVNLMPTTTAPIPGGVVSAVPVALATFPMTGLVAQDMTGQISTDMITGQTYASQQNFMNSNGPDKHPNSSHERGSGGANNYGSDENYRNRIRGNRPENQKKNLNGSGNRPRNSNKGPGYQNPMPFGNYSKYEQQMNGSNTFGNTFGEKTSTTYGPHASGRGGRPQHQRQNNGRPDARQRSNPNTNYSSNFGATAAK